MKKKLSLAEKKRRFKQSAKDLTVPAKPKVAKVTSPTGRDLDRRMAQYLMSIADVNTSTASTHESREIYKDAVPHFPLANADYVKLEQRLVRLGMLPNGSL
ncbi:hypothetical protein fHeYen902_112c [Yersinia phage fHe-Yen9-02]|nr:hypothetical protein fHeYen902_112c [Yersinia phage fHe-Yen9-02]